ncbi:MULTISPECIES: DUF3024 domain-containing protein [Vibrio]|uniref:DUF3024 domain-containing protein n=1 Tax=Vibrio splendidus TaxID=29497 RepID=A0A2N7JVA9_VIBSP|nr:DUF3024 domain-containing protein [Vibrio splendidus]PMM63608.1 hypothetical protein BCT54_02555 [Vibrio splendidus]
MAFSEFECARYLKMMEQCVEAIRPPQAIRAQIDFVAEIDNQSLMLYELSSSFSRDGSTQRYPVAKITYVKTKKHWVLYGMRASGKWMKHSTHTLLELAIGTLQADPDSNFFG